MTDIAIRVDNLSKLYPEPAATHLRRRRLRPGRAGHLGAVHQRPDTTSTVLSASLRDALTGMFRRGNQSTNSQSTNPDDLWALKDVSLEVKRGELVDTRVRAVEATLASRFSPRYN